MTENRSLTDFLGSEEEDTGTDECGDDDATVGTDTDDHGGGDPSEGTHHTETVEEEPSEPIGEEPIDSKAVTPVSATYVWTPEGGECAHCGDRVEARWRDGAEFVCVDCKEW